MRNGLFLLKTFLLSDSYCNVFRHTADQKKKRRMIASAIGSFLLHALIAGYCLLTCLGMGASGLIDAVPVMTAMLVSALSFLLTFLKTNGCLFGFREYDMMMSLPVSPETLAASRFLYMYFKSLPMILCISLSMMIGYGIYASLGVPVYLLWVLLCLFVPLIPMLTASFFGFLIAKISAPFRKKALIQTILMMIFLIFCFSLRYIITFLFRNTLMEDVLSLTAETFFQAAKYYPPARWFSDSVLHFDLFSILLLILSSVILFAVLFAITGKFYRKINTSLMSHTASKNYRMRAQKKKSPLQAIAFKEYRRMMGSSLYMTNAAVGEVLAVLLGILSLFFGFERMIRILTNDAPFEVSILQPAIPFAVYFFTGMVATTAFSFSLEGRNYWILKSLPVRKADIAKGKILFHLTLSVPASFFGILCLCISANVPAAETILYLLLGIILCAFSGVYGAVCGIRYMRLDWENEIEVIKQGSAATIYVLPNMFACMAMAVLAVFLGMRMDRGILTALLAAVIFLLTILLYRHVLSLSENIL